MTCPSRGASSQRPWSLVPTSAANTLPESKRGKHNQSTEPLRDTSAAVRWSDNNA